MEPKGIDFLVFMNTSPIFKGVSVLIVGIIALLFSYWMVKRWKESISWQFMIFTGLAIFIVFYGLYILIFQPAWWVPPWWNQ